MREKYIHFIFLKAEVICLIKRKKKKQTSCPPPSHTNEVSLCSILEPNSLAALVYTVDPWTVGEFLLKPGHFEYYVLKLWILCKHSVLASCLQHQLGRTQREVLITVSRRGNPCTVRRACVTSDFPETSLTNSLLGVGSWLEASPIT